MGQRILKVVKPVASGVVQGQSLTSSWDYTLYSYDANGQVMATEKLTMNPVSGTNLAKVDERYVYGATRLGSMDTLLVLFNTVEVVSTNPSVVPRIVGQRQYELNNHLGDVNGVVSDWKTVSSLNDSYQQSTFVGGSLDNFAISSGVTGATLTSQSGELTIAATNSTGSIRKLYNIVGG